MQPEEFVIDTLLRPYVRAVAHLLFEEGLHYEGHTQNVLFEIDGGARPGCAAGRSSGENAGRLPRGSNWLPPGLNRLQPGLGLTGRIILRDLADTTVNIALRLAKGRPFPVPGRGLLPASIPFPVASNAADFRNNAHRPFIQRGFDTVERYGLSGFVWPINTSIRRFFPGYDAPRVERRYLELWQEAAVASLRVRPLLRRRPFGLATDEAIAFHLGRVDWQSLGAMPAALPSSAEPMRIHGTIRPRPGRIYRRLTCGWGELYLAPAAHRPARFMVPGDDRWVPAFFLPAF